ncbi:MULTISPECIES: hypothetical protein [Arenibacter]|jgi:hypothetical protein|uniref:Uncharacterized protein n=1 Tax=Arenibacter algicola TaxID=616991 RepID=A0A221UWE6_9FLAO|nr:MULTISPECIES: hypothetical protein [Arenibacter]ASO05652.1 hypothetical protein AREALGSMS7_02196 [Arenibacter algicola]GBF20796.1 hypothetical protein C21_02971 [Arenibacter sp. NBRC 103722]|tara:strand:- start:70693 stop:70977 length:285 start_codon:yes stop_codon:yes gene_type:complete
MSKTSARWLLVLGLVIVGFGVGIYLQDLKHQESTKAAWKANRFNVARFNKIMRYAGDMNDQNWASMRDSIGGQLDSLMILRFRKEVDSIKKTKK